MPAYQSLRYGAVREVAGMRIGRLTYASPLELVLYTAAFGGVVGLGVQLVNLFDRVVNSATKASDASVHMKANRLIKEKLGLLQDDGEIALAGADQLEIDLGNGMKLTTQVVRKSIEQNIDHAAKALERADRIELED